MSLAAGNFLVFLGGILVVIVGVPWLAFGPGDYGRLFGGLVCATGGRFMVAAWRSGI